LIGFCKTLETSKKIVLKRARSKILGCFAKAFYLKRNFPFGLVGFCKTSEFLPVEGEISEIFQILPIKPKIEFFQLDLARLFSISPQISEELTDKSL
jgi:hypothetical protein